MLALFTTTNVGNTKMNQVELFNELPSPQRANEILDERLEAMGEKRDMAELKYIAVS